MKKYDHKKIEKKWQNFWDKKGTYNAENNSKKKKYYTLIEFPYPSGDGLHVGHPRPYIGMDIISRKRRMEGYNVLYPIGWDAFGLPTENYAIKTGKDPRVVTKKNTDTFRKQIKSLGVSFDWSKEINTTDPKYYKWTQWIFLQFLKKGLAYKAKMAINWCPKDKIGLANEEVINGACERCGTAVEKREKEQWMLAITKYADRLYDDLDTVDYLPQIKLSQRNWIGKSEGVEIDFAIKNSDKKIKVFTTRPDTIFGVTFLAIAPEIAKKLTEKDFGIKTDIEKENKDKVGVDTGLRAINPANKEEIPVWVVNYVSAEYGTGAIMGVPAHDERDFEFAKKYNLEIRQVIAPHLIDTDNAPVPGKKIVKRKVVQVVVKHWEEDKVIRIAWKGAPYKSFVIGGCEEGETWEEAAKRETIEETGYKDFKFIKKVTLELRSEWHAGHKDENRYALMNIFFIQLRSGERQEMSEEEKAKHDVEWIPFSKIPESYHPVSEMDYIWKGLNGGEEDIFTGSGILINSGKFSEMDSKIAKKEIIKFVGGKEKTTFKLRDWVFSRQRYWGEPIPVIHCAKPDRPDGRSGGCGIVPVPDKDLPVELPKVKNYQPTDSGESPLANIRNWVNVKCPKCKGPGRRETDTMPNWAGSSWYYLRYTDPKNKKAFADKKNLKYWTPVDWYNGGNEHTTLHLLYSRFWHKFLYDLKLVPTSEPYMKRTSHGIILAEGGEKMSKSRGNVVNPDDIVKTFGADTLRLYEMFLGPFDQAAAWNEDAIIGPRRFLERVWSLSAKIDKKNKDADSKTHILIKKITEDIELMKFNTAISSFMIFVNEKEKEEKISFEDYKILLRLLAPFAPHIAEELWVELGNKKSIHVESWPKHDEAKIMGGEVTIIVQVNGKVRAQFKAQSSISEIDAIAKAKSLPEVNKWITGAVKRHIFIPNKLINIVV